MIEISCFYVDYKTKPVNITFIKYNKFIKIIFDKKEIILSFVNLINCKILFEFYILSLLCTEDTSNIGHITIIYGNSTEIIDKNLNFTGFYDFIILEKRRFKNPLLSKEPKRETSNKKQNKFFKSLFNYIIDTNINPFYCIEYYQEQLIVSTQIKKFIEYETNIYNL